MHQRVSTTEENFTSRALQTPAFSGATSKFQSISPSAPYLSFSHSFAFLKWPQSSCDSSVQVRKNPETETHKSFVRAQWAGMHARQNQVLLLVHSLDSHLRRRTPRKEHNSPRALLGHDINHLLCKLLPPFLLMAVGLVRLDGQARVQKQDSVIRPWCEQTSVFRWCFE